MAPVETLSSELVAVAFVAAKAIGGWMGAIKNAPITAATRDAVLRLRPISLSLHQFFND